MTSEAYLIINRRGILPMAKRRVQVSNNEIMVRLKVNIPANLFDRMTPVAELSINENQVILPVDIDIPVFTQVGNRNTNTNQR